MFFFFFFFSLTHITNFKVIRKSKIIYTQCIYDCLSPGNKSNLNGNVVWWSQL